MTTTDAEKLDQQIAQAYENLFKAVQEECCGPRAIKYGVARIVRLEKRRRQLRQSQLDESNQTTELLE